jgi:hypothetical protein
VEAPPGIEPGMEVLQTSALPLGDGAVWRAARAKVRAYVRKLPKLKLGPTNPGYYRTRFVRASRTYEQSAGQGARPRSEPASELERETGFEPATSTLARSHSTTELFPLSPECRTPNVLQRSQPTQGIARPLNRAFSASELGASLAWIVSRQCRTGWSVHRRRRQFPQARRSKS